MQSMRSLARIVTILTLCTSILTACSTTTNSNPSRNTGNPPSTTSSTTVALVIDSGEQGNSDFNRLANDGYLRAEQQYGFASIVIPVTAPNNDVASLTTAAEEADMVVVVGFFMQTPLDRVAREFLNKKFAIVDGCAVPDPNVGTCENLPNVASLIFNEQEAGCIVGTLAAQMEMDGPTKLPKLLGKNTIGAVGSQPVPSVDHYIAGYKYCAKKVDPTINVVVSYANDYLDPAKCRALAESQIADQHADILFQVAYACGIGVLDAATDKHVYSIGVDIDQSRDVSGKTRPSVITSALKRVDTAVYDIINDAENDQYAVFVQNPLIFDLAHDGVSFATPNSEVPQDAIDKAKEYEYEIQIGALIPPT